LKEWTWEDVLPYYKKMETSNRPKSQWHGYSGPFPITQMTKSDITPVQLALIHAAVENGFREIEVSMRANSMSQALPPDIVNSKNEYRRLTWMIQ
jgi:choline dehydrogenase